VRHLGNDSDLYADKSIFKTTKFKFDTIAERMRELAYLNKNIS
jgi:DNA gyrase subunit B